MSEYMFYSGSSPMPMEKFSALYRIMEYSFPPTERGSERFHYSEFERREFRCLCYEPEGIPAAFMNYYDLEKNGLVFVEHFAVDESLRGQGRGSDMLQRFMEHYCRSLIVLEVEPPEGEAERRRIAFYQRMGMHLNDGEYFQPEFYGKCAALPLRLMTNRPLSKADFDDVMSTIHREIYRK